MEIRTCRIISLMLLLVNSVGALAGGGGLMADPSGKGNQISLEWLKYTPFENFLIPGLILFLANGLFGLVVIAMILFRYAQYPLYIIFQGALLGGWIVIQMMLLRTVNFLHITFILIAIALLVLGWLQMKAGKEAWKY